MASNPNLTRIGAGRKQTTQPLLHMRPSPTRQRSLEEVTQREKEGSFKEIQTMMLAMQELMSKNHEDLKQEMGEVRNDTGELKVNMRLINEKLESFQQQINKNEQKISEMEEKMEKEKRRVDEINESLFNAYREIEMTVVTLETEKANFFLRFQNVKEEKGEDLTELMADILSKALGIGKEEMVNEIDEIYRINTNFARKNNLPREIHIKFVKKSIRDEILFRIRDDPLEYRDRQMIILKQVPRRVREMRRPYQGITSKLIKKNINFRWLIPEGIMVTWNDKRYRLTTIEQAEEFYEQNFGDREGGERSGVREARGFREDLMEILQMEKEKPQKESKNTREEELIKRNHDDGIRPEGKKDYSSERITRSKCK